MASPTKQHEKLKQGAQCKAYAAAELCTVISTWARFDPNPTRCEDMAHLAQRSAELLNEARIERLLAEDPDYVA